MTPTTCFLRGLALVAALLAAAPVARSQTQLFEIQGSAEGVGFGLSAYVGDVNGDGAPEFATAEPRRSAGGLLQNGRVRLHDGATAAVLWSVEGAHAFGRAGSSLAGLHDVDGDGVPDLAVGAPGVAGGLDPGRVRVLSGADGSTLHTLVGSQPGARYGFAVAGLSDVDGEGLPELLVGAPGHDGAAGADTGAAWVLDPLTGAVLASWEGGAAGDELGHAVSGGSGSLVVNGQNKWGDNPSPTIGFADNPAPTIGAPQIGGDGPGYALTVDPLTGAVLATHTGAQAEDRFGFALAELGDITGDGVSDLLVGSDPRKDAQQAIGEGYTRLVDGATREVFDHREGLEWANNFGVAAVGTGDVDGDGVADYLVGESLDDTVALDAGRALLLSGADGATLAEVHGGVAGEQLGRRVAALGDLNGDGLAEFGVAAPEHDGGRGRLVVYTLGPWSDAGGGTAGASGVPALGGRGGLLGGHEVELELRDAAPLATATLVYGTTLLADADGLPVPSADVLVTGLQTDASGALDHRFTWPAGIASGSTTWFQIVVDDPAAPGGTSRSAVLAGTAP